MYVSKIEGERNKTGTTGDEAINYEVPSGKRWTIRAASVWCDQARDCDITLFEKEHNITCNLVSSKGSVSGFEYWSGEIHLEYGHKIYFQWYSLVATDLYSHGFLYDEEDLPTILEPTPIKPDLQEPMIEKKDPKM